MADNIKIIAKDLISSHLKNASQEITADVTKALAGLSQLMYLKVSEEAGKELKSTNQTYQDALSFEEIAEGVWMVKLDEKAMWIEEGVEANTDMKPGLLKNAKKISKDGHKYRSIPFKYNKKSSQVSASAQNVVNQLKQKLKKEGISFKRIEKDANGSPRVGKLHELNLGGPNLGKGNTPAFKGVKIYQSMGKSGQARRDVLVFRTVSEGPASAGKWFSGGYKKKQFLEKGYDWAINEWENSILPEIVNKWGK